MSINDFFDSKIKIIQTLRRSNKTLIMQHVAKRSHMSVQLVNYHVAQIVEYGIIVASRFEEKTLYTLQESYYSDQLLEDLSQMLVPYMEKMSKTMDLTQIKVTPTEAIIRNLFMFMRLFQSEIDKNKKKPMEQKDEVKDVLQIT